MRYEKVISRIHSGEMSRADLIGLRENAIQKAPCRFVWNLTALQAAVYPASRLRHRRLQRVDWQML
jgi:hypothetical protein